jgi:parallel beta-helix repeat protein
MKGNWQVGRLPKTPHPGVRRLEPLIGRWRIAGPDVEGEVVYEWMEGGFSAFPFVLAGNCRDRRSFGKIPGLDVVVSSRPYAERPQRRGGPPGSQVNGIHEVTGSIPVNSTNSDNDLGNETKRPGRLGAPLCHVCVTLPRSIAEWRLGMAGGPGVYREDLVLRRTVSLRGVGSPVLMGTGEGTVFLVEAPGCSISGFVIEGSGTGLTNRMDAAVTLASSGNRVVGNRMRRVFYGVVAGGSSRNEIVGNEIIGFTDLPFGRRGDGIYL